jgi:acetyl esterase
MLFRTLLIVAVSANAAAAQNRNYPPEFPEARAEVYKTIGDVKLNIYIFSPKDQDKKVRPAVVFFFGGGWRSGTPAQFHQHCKHLASRGIVAMTADYRVSTRNNTKATACVADAKSAIRWVRQNAKRLGIDPERVAAGGGSAGGHLAACTGVIRGFEEKGEDLSISSVPNALILFNPALVLAELEGEPPLSPKQMEGLPERMGTAPKNLSPFHHVAKGAPPTIIFHGKADSTIPYKTAEQFTAAMKREGNECELQGFDDQAHGFFNYGRGDGSHYETTVKQMDGFLISLKYIKAKK